ncbi:MAG: hypothetical protein H0W83_16140 [Planctomycetes bacterium]|nr:hypothetical protein [Planctomycetota bacterium]
MIMADVLTWFLIISGIYLVVVAYWLAAVALFPASVERCRDLYGRRSVAASLVGAAALVPLAALGAITAAIPHPLISGTLLVIALVPVLMALVGSAGLALRIGSGLAGSTAEGMPGRNVLRGGGVLGLTFLLPFIGWFVVLPWALISGLGVALLAMRSTRRTHAVGPAALPLAADQSSVSLG